MLIILFLLAGLTSSLTTWLLLRSGVVGHFADLPNHRSLHHSPIPRIGGIAVVGVVAAITSIGGLLLSWYDPQAIDMPIAVVLICTAFLTCIGMRDDQHGVGVGLRAAIQLLCGFSLWLAWTMDGRFDPPVSFAATFVLLLIPGILSWSANLFNFMDGSDGIAGAMSIAGFGGLALLAPANSLTALIASVAAGSAAGFIVFNWHPAKVFLGDAGSVPLGFLAATLGINGTLNQYWPLWLPIACFMPFIFDASTTLIWRVCRGHKPWEAHREHAYQRLILAGIGQRPVAIGVFVLSVLSSVLAAAGSNQTGYVFFLVWAVIITIHSCIYRWALRYPTRS